MTLAQCRFGVAAEVTSDNESFSWSDGEDFEAATDVERQLSAVPTSAASARAQTTWQRVPRAGASGRRRSLSVTPGRDLSP